MKKIKIYLSVFILLFTIFSCEDNREEYLDRYDTILYFLNSGEHDVTLYKTGENSIVPVKVYKAGYTTSATPTAEMGVLDDDFLRAYNLENGTAFTMFPKEYYTPKVEQITFDGAQMCKSFEIEFETDVIDEALDLESTNYVLPLYLTSADSVNTKMNYILLRPSVAIPIINLSRSGTIYQTVTDAVGPGNFSFDIAVPFTNIWELEFSLELDESLLDGFNKESLVSYSFLKEGYSITNMEDGKVIVKPGENSKKIEVTFDTSIPYGNYVFPFHLKAVSKEGVVIDPERNVCILAVTYTPALSSFSAINLTANMLTSNAIEPSEGSLAGLLDGDIETFFHSCWSVESTDGGPHYIQIALNESYSMFAFDFITRLQNNNGAPKEIVLSVSQNGTDFTTIGHITSGMPVDPETSYNSNGFISPVPAKILRMTVMRNKDDGSFFSLAELSLKGIK